MRRITWFIICLVLVAASVGVGVGIGIMVPRFSRIGPGSPTSSPAATATPGLHIEELKSAEELFDLAGQKAVVLKYSGGDVDFWVEMESQGGKSRLDMR